MVEETKEVVEEVKVRGKEEGVTEMVEEAKEVVEEVKVKGKEEVVTEMVQEAKKVVGEAKDNTGFYEEELKALG